VLCADETAKIQALDRSQPLLPMRPGQVERRTRDYIHDGITSLFAACDTQSGRVGQRHRHRAIEFRKFLDTIDARSMKIWTSFLVDNSAIHKTRPDQALAGEASSLSSALHAEGRVLDQSRRALVRLAHR
jgi:hypothetical protein